MLQDQESNQIKTNPKFPWLLVLRWLLGLYLIAGCILGAIAISSNWTKIHNIQVMNPHFNIYPALIGWVLKFASGILFILASKRLLIVVPAWIGIFLYDFLARSTLSQLSPDFYLAVVIQACILSFAIWMHGRGRLK